jgi:hypothetical protein
MSGVSEFVHRKHYASLHNPYLHARSYTIAVLLVVALQPLNGGDGHLTGQIRIFSKVFIVPDRGEDGRVRK